MSFTFQYVSIKTGYAKYDDEYEYEFTFQYVSIKTYHLVSMLLKQSYLHSNMFLLRLIT